MSEEKPKSKNDIWRSIYQEFAKPFPKEAYGIDGSRGFDLVSIKAQFVIERLNEVVGIPNWHFDGEYENGQSGVMYKGKLTFFPKDEEMKHEVVGVGFSPMKKNIGDTFKSAATDCLCKSASRVGIGNDVFKGLVKLK